MYSKFSRQTLKGFQYKDLCGKNIFKNKIIDNIIGSHYLSWRSWVFYIYLTIYLCMNHLKSFSLSIHPSIYISLYISIYLTICLCNHLAIYRSICLSLSTYLSIYLTIHHFHHIYIFYSFLIIYHESLRHIITFSL